MGQSLIVGVILRNRYQIVKLLGSGGFGDTYLAVDLDLPGQPKCVVKQLKPKDPNPAVLPIAKSLFEREAQILHQLGNENDQIPRLFAHFEENGEFYLVQEFVDGHDLTQEMTPGQPKSENVVFKLLKDILEVLAVVHQHNIIHRDIKPPNIMRRRKDGKIVLIDFGAVKEIGALGVNAMGQTSLTVAVGSPGYMPSEQAHGKPRLASDIYAVGMLGIQALTGLMPYELQEDPRTGDIIWRNAAQVSNSLADVLDTMVRYSFSQRYQSAAEALQALIPTVVPLPPPQVPSTVPSPPPQVPSTVVSSLPAIPATVPAPPSQLLASPATATHNLGKKPGLKNQWLVGGSIAAIMAVLVGGGLAYRLKTQGEQQSKEQAQIVEKARNFKADKKFSDCITQAQTVSPNYPDSYAKAQGLLNECHLAQAQVLASSGKFQEAIAEASVIPSGSPSYPDAQKLIGQESESLLKQAMNKYQEEGLDAAIAIAQKIPANSSGGKKAQQLIPQWKTEAAANDNNLKSAQKAFAQKQWQSAINSANKVTNVPFWKRKAQAIVQQAEAKVAAEKPPVASNSTTPEPSSVTQTPVRVPSQTYTPPRQVSTPPQTYTPSRQTYAPPHETYTPPRQVSTPPQRTYTPPRHNTETLPPFIEGR